MGYSVRGTVCGVQCARYNTLYTYTSALSIVQCCTHSANCTHSKPLRDLCPSDTLQCLTAQQGLHTNDSSPTMHL